MGLARTRNSERNRILTALDEGQCGFRELSGHAYEMLKFEPEEKSGEPRPKS